MEILSEKEYNYLNIRNIRNILQGFYAVLPTGKEFCYEKGKTFF